MISAEYQKFEKLVVSEPVEAVLNFQDEIYDNRAEREVFLEELTEQERWYWAKKTFAGASKIADKLIDSCPSLFTWEKNEYECTSGVIETQTVGSYKITRKSKDCRDIYEIYIDNEALSLAISRMGLDTDDEEIDLLAEVNDITEQDFSIGDMTKLEWGFELLMTISLDAKGYNEGL